MEELGKIKGCSIFNFFLKYKICQSLIALKKEREKEPMDLEKGCGLKEEKRF